MQELSFDHPRHIGQNLALMWLYMRSAFHLLDCKYLHYL